MNFTNCKKKFLLFLMFFTWFTPLLSHPDVPETDQVETIEPSEIEQLNTILENQLKAILSHYDAVDLILQDLALIVNNDQIQNIKNKRALIDEIKNIRGIIESVKKDAFVQVNPASLYLVVKILDSIIAHINDAIKKGFTDLAPFDLDKCVKRSLNEEVDLNELDNEIIATRKGIEDLDQLAKNAGLHWYNKAYRKVDDYVIQPSLKYNIPQRAGKTLLASAILFYFFWFHTERGTRPENESTNEGKSRYNQNQPFAQEMRELKQKVDIIVDNYLPKEIVEKATQNLQIQASQAVVEKTVQKIKPKYYFWEYWLRGKVGPYPHTDGSWDHLDENYHTLDGKNPLRWLGSIEHGIMSYNHGHMPLGALMLGITPTMFSNELSAAADWVAKRVTAMHNRLKGGIYRKKAYENDNKVEPKITFDDLVGLDRAKEELSLIVRYIEDPERWDRGKLTPEKGYLLTGPTRTGKSYTAEALAGEIKKVLKKQNRNPDEFGFYVISASQIIQFGLTKILAEAKREAPCVLFIDEIDLLGLQRAGGNRELLNEFLLAMSGCNGYLENDPKKQVIILAATNKSENLDEALKQRGRFGKEIRFEYPGFNDRKKFLLRRLNNLSINLEMFNLDKLALETEGYSFEDLNAMIKRAFQRSKILGQAISQHTLEESLDSEVRNIIMDESKNLPLKERELLAIHQAGHAVAHVLLKTPQKLSKVTVRPVQPKLKEETVWDPYYKEDDDKQQKIEYGKVFTYHEHDTINFSTRQEKVNLCKIQLAGHAAEEVLLKSSGYSYHRDDKERALQIAKSIVFEGIKNVDKLPKKIQNQMFDEAFQLLNQCKKEINELLEENKEKLQLVANMLLQKQTLTAQEVEDILAGKTCAKGQAQNKEKTDDAQQADVSKAIARELGLKEIQPDGAAAAG